MKTLMKLTLALIVVSSWQCGSNPVTVDKVGEEIPVTILNLNFEQAFLNETPQFWIVFGDGYELKVDSSEAYSGKKSLRIRFIDGVDFAASRSSFPLGDALGKTLRFSGYIKTENIDAGWAGLWMRVDGPDGVVLAFDNMNNRPIVGTTDWQEYTIELEIDAAAISIRFGALLTGRGTAWFDAFSFKVDGKVYEPPLLHDGRQ